MSKIGSLVVVSLLFVITSVAFNPRTIPSSSRSACLFMSNSEETMHFGRFVIAARHIFYRTSLSAAFVNLRPIVPGHVLVMPERVVPRMRDLSEEEYLDLWSAVRVVQQMLESHYQSTDFNVAVQDGRDAGQSVPHVHVHILPRKVGDFERNDDVYDELQEWAPRKRETQAKLDVPDDQDRTDRTVDQMAEEASIYRNLVQVVEDAKNKE